MSYIGYNFIKGGDFLKNKIKYIYLWALSFVILFVAFVFFVRFAFDPTTIHAICLAVPIICFCVVYRIADKKLMLPEGYSVIQAIAFYRSASKIDGKNYNASQLGKKLRNAAKSRDFAKDKSDAELLTLYKQGKELSELLFGKSNNN